MDEAEKQRLDRQAIRGTVARGDRTRSQNMNAMAADYTDSMVQDANKAGAEDDIAAKEQDTAAFKAQETTNMLRDDNQELRRKLEEATASPPVFEMPALNDDLRDILGRPNFTCISISQRLREMGYSIKHRAEEEQAAVIHLLLQHYFANGTAWRDTVQAFLERGQPDANQSAAAGDAISSVHGPDDETPAGPAAPHQPSGDAPLS